MTRLEPGFVRGKRAATGRCEGHKPFGEREGEQEVIDTMRQPRAAGMGYQRLPPSWMSKALSHAPAGWYPYTVSKILARSPRSSKTTPRPDIRPHKHSTPQGRASRSPQAVEWLTAADYLSKTAEESHHERFPQIWIQAGGMDFFLGLPLGMIADIPFGYIVRRVRREWD